mgnify:CR=1 FL=1
MNRKIHFNDDSFLPSKTNLTCFDSFNHHFLFFLLSKVWIHNPVKVLGAYINKIILIKKYNEKA